MDGIIPGGGRNSPKGLCDGLRLSLGKLMLSSADPSNPGAVGDRVMWMGLSWSMLRLEGCCGVGGSRRRGGGGRSRPDKFGSVADLVCWEGDCDGGGCGR